MRFNDQINYGVTMANFLLRETLALEKASVGYSSLCTEIQLL